jgi:hypothetical protein
MRSFKVLTFFENRPGRKPLVTAYTRDANPLWDGCKVIDIEAENGTDAKKIAIKKRKEMGA